MREIKFRGKSSTSGEWKIGSLWLNNEQALIIPSPLFDEDEEDQNVIPKTVGQFTGMKDRFGVEIYEGDIVSSNVSFDSDYDSVSVSHSGEVKYNNEYCSFTVPCTYDGSVKEPNHQYCNFLHQMDSALIFICGNIHDNPELIG